MLVLGIILAIVGVGGLVYGFIQNSDPMAQLGSLVSSGSTNPGTIFIIIGAVVAVAGIILAIVGGKKKNA